MQETGDRNKRTMDALAVANNALLESEARLHAIIRTAVDGVVTIDLKGVILSINPAGAELFGYSEEELLGEKVNMLMPNPHARDHDTYMHDYQRTRKPKIIGIGRQVEGLRKDGSRFPFKLSVSEVQLPDSVIYTGVIHDLSAQMQAEERLKKLNEELEALVKERTAELNEAVLKLRDINTSLSTEVGKRERAEDELKDLLNKERELSELKSRFVSMASHEFRTPLSGILSSAALIGRYATTEQEPKRQTHVRRIRSAVGDLTSILDDFLSLDKLQTGRVTLTITSFSLNDLVGDAITDISNMLKEDQRIELTADTDIQIIQDRGILKNVLLNLLSNGVKYSPEGSLITVFAAATEELVTLRVVDEGIGIPEADKKHMFERFFRASNSTNIKGTGLGLNIVLRYMKILGGSISLESEEKKGSIFTIVFPVSKSE